MIERLGPVGMGLVQEVLRLWRARQAGSLPVPVVEAASAPSRSAGLEEMTVSPRLAEPVVAEDDNQILARAADLGAAHGRDMRHRLPRDDIPAAFGITEPGDLMYMVIAAYEDNRDIARAEADPRGEQWPQPISRAHKAWLRSNLVNHADLADMLRVPVGRIYQMAGAAGWPEPVVDRPRKYWYWWPHLEPVLASRGLVLAPGVAPPPGRPAPSWWGDLPASPDFRDFLRENLVDFAGFATLYNLDRQTILSAGRWPDYPEPVIGRRGNYWYWLPDLDRFLVRHRDIGEPGWDAGDPSWPSTARDGIQAVSPAPAARRARRPRHPARTRPRRTR